VGAPPDDQRDPAFAAPEEAEALLRRLSAVPLAPADPEPRPLDSATPIAAERAEGRHGPTRCPAEARYRALVEQIPAVTFLAPLDGSTSELRVSPQIEALLGFSAREWLDNPILPNVKVIASSGQKGASRGLRGPRASWRSLTPARIC
jgi:PAS domain-containing protein